MSFVQPFVPATEALLSGWCGPLADPYTDDDGRDLHAVLVAFSVDGATVHATTEDGDYVTRAAVSLRLDTRRREVQHLLCDRLAIPERVRGSGWCAALTWWAGVTGKALSDVLGAYIPSDMLVGGRPQLYTRRSVSSLLSVLVAADGWSISRNGLHALNQADRTARGPETGSAGKEAADLAALAHDVAYIDVVDGCEVLTLPPIIPGGGPIVWRPA